MPQIADHILVQRIGRGGYGEVWLARNVIGTLRAAKELADDARTSQNIDPETCGARTLAEEMKTHQRLPPETSLQIALALASALAHLHAQKPIHRDIKPSNIIFVKGAPKFADIRLLTEAEAAPKSDQR